MINEPWTANDPHSEVFRVVTLSPDMFVNPSIPAEGLLQSREKERMLSGKVNCSLPFTSPDGRACLAVGCAEGLWIGYRSESQLELDSLRRVSDLKMVTQCALLEKFGIFLVLANKMLFAYDIESLVPSCLQRANTFHIPQKLNGSLDVQFFSVGSLEGRTLVIYMTKKRLNSVFRILEPIVVSKSSQGGPLNSHLDMWKSRSRGFRIYRDFSLPLKAYNVVFLGARIAILCKKGFEIMHLSDSQGVAIPRLYDPRHKELAKRCRSSRPIGLFRSSNDEFLLCYDKFGLYINTYGDVNPTKGTIEWKVIADHVACHPPYVLIFNAHFIEVRHIESGRLCQIINGQSLRCTWNGYGSSIPLSRPDPDGMGEETPVLGTSVCGVMGTDDCSQGPSRPSHIAGAAVECVFELVPTGLPSPSRRASVEMSIRAPNLDGPSRI